MKTKWKYLNPWYIPALIIVVIAFVLYPISWLVLKVAYTFSNEKRPREMNESGSAKKTPISQ